MESDGSDEDEVKAHCLRFTDALTEVPNGDAQAASELLLQDRGLTSLDSLEPFKNLKKLELKGNHIASLGWLEMNHSLCWLGLAKNRLRRLTHLQNLSSLAVLDFSDNKVARLDGLQHLQGLKALIAARNRITLLDGISPKKNPLLETIVLSHNQLQSVSLAGFKNLKKVSLANNRLHSFPSLQKLPALAELRLNGNQITTIPSLVTTLPHLTTLDVGKNLINQLAGFETLKGLLWLSNLNVRGNPASGDEEMPKEMWDILSTLPRLEIVNGKRQGFAKPQKPKKLKAGHDRHDRHEANNGRDGHKAGLGRGRGAGRGRGMAVSETVEAWKILEVWETGDSIFERARSRSRSTWAAKGQNHQKPGKGRETAATQDCKQDPDKRSEPISSCEPISFEEGKGQKDQKGQSSSCQSKGRSASCASAKAKEDSESEKNIETCTMRYEDEGLLRMLAVRAQGAFVLGRGPEVLGLKREPLMPTMRK